MPTSLLAPPRGRRALSACYVCLTLLLPLALSLAASSNQLFSQQPAPEPLQIGTRRELFVDRYLIDSLDGLTLKLHEPKPTEPMQTPANDMEYGTIVWDGELYRMYTREGRGAKFDGDVTEVTRYCESRDGIHWTKPSLGIVELDGSKDNNVILHEAPYCHNFAPFLDENPNVPADQKFKALAGTVKSGLVAFISPDGIHWNKLQDNPVLNYTKEYAFDSQNVAFWSTVESQYVCYFRHFLDGKLRSICRTTSKDFVQWSEPIPMRPNLPGEHLYTSLAHPYFRAPHITIATPTRFHPQRGESTDILFMTARAESPFDRTFRQAFLRPGLDPNRWGNRSNYAAWHIVPTGFTAQGPSELSLYTTPFQRFTLRLDGFASIHADADPGTATTKPFTMGGDLLLVNASTSAGGVLRVEITDPQGVPLEGFRFDDCVPFVGDAIEHQIQWKDASTSLSKLIGKPIRIRFELTDADLFAIQFAPAPSNSSALTNPKSQPLETEQTTESLPTTNAIATNPALATNSALTSNPEPVDFSSEIRPILQQRCFACHGALKQESGLRLDTAKSIHQGSDSGPVLQIENVESSELLQRISTDNSELRMPPEGHPLETEQIERLRLWIQQGAPIPTHDNPEPAPSEHWAFKQPVRPAIPQGNGHPIDAFIHQALQREGLAPQPIATPPQRLRRLYLDLIGLPPPMDVLENFERNPTPEAYEAIVDQLLASPQYGERWGRHWMDVWRYADWFGRRYVPDVWNSAPQLWHWRDWIVRSLNSDVGYDQMIREMLAADEYKPGDMQAAVATGYIIRNWYALNPNDWMRNTVEHTGKAFLGLTFQCAHCHDHKYDPITQENYFQFRAFFEPIYVRQDRIAGQADPGPFQDYEYSTLRKVQRLGTVSIFDKKSDAPTWFYTGGDERNRMTERGSIPPGFPDFLKPNNNPNAQNLTPAPIDLPPESWYPGLRADLIQSQRDEFTREYAEAQQALQTVKPTDEALAAIDATKKEKLAEELANLKKTSSDKHDQNTPLQGKQSLVFDAISGRRMLYRSAPEIDAVKELDSVSFLVMVPVDAHFNFQLTRNNATGATATYIGFEKGAIKSYKPGTFEEFEVGRYSDDQKQKAFQVRLTLHPEKDQCTLDVTTQTTNPQSENDSLTSDPRLEPNVLVEKVAIALNGWNPVGNPNQGILFDARPGTFALVDDWSYHHAATESSNTSIPLLAFSFEADQIADQVDLAGMLNWESAASYSIPPATSLVSTAWISPESRKTTERIANIERILSLPQLPLETAKAKLRWKEAQRNDYDQRVAAETARYVQHLSETSEEWKALKDSACNAQQQLELEKSQWELAQSNLELAELDVQTMDPKLPADQIEALQKKRSGILQRYHAATAAMKNAKTQAHDNYQPLSIQYPKTSTGRRKALAGWITAPTNPLTARVGINHIWMRHFHQPLVNTVFDFGRNGTKPTHPELLDWLAVEWMESGWSMKHIHKLMVTSAAYQRDSSGMDNPAIQSDPDNRWLWKMNSGRMEAEVLRDSLLAAANCLDPKLGGQELENSESFTTYRRSLYYSCQPEEDGKSPLGMLFDGPDAADCYRRTRTIIPQQSLALTNSSLIHSLAPKIVAHIDSLKANHTVAQVPEPQEGVDERGADAKIFIDAAFRHLLNRSPRPEEMQVCYAFYAVEPKAKESLVRILVNHPDYLTIR